MHLRGPADGGWRVIEVWDSQKALDRFIDERRLPAMRVVGGLAPSRREVFPAYHAGVAG